MTKAQSPKKRTAGRAATNQARKTPVRKKAVKKAVPVRKRAETAVARKVSKEMSDIDKRLVMNTLRDEHAYIGSLRKAMQREVNKLNRKGLPDYLILRDMMRYLMEYPDILHHPLEDRLFARLLNHKSSVRSDVLELLDEHKDLAKESQYLFYLLDDIISHRKKPKKSLLRLQLTDFIEQYNQHVALEEKVVFPEAEKTLLPDDWQVLASSLEIYEDPLFESKGNEDEGNFESLRLRINENVTDATSRVAMAEMLGFYSILESYDAVAEGAGDLANLAKVQLKNTVRDNWKVLTGAKDSDSLLKTNLKLIDYGLRESSRIINHTVRASGQPYRSHYQSMRKTN